MKTTKEELLKENARLVQTNKEWEDANRNRKLEFAKAFDWKKPRGAYDTTAEYRAPTWEEIFVQFGKLLSSHQDKYFDESIQSLNDRVLNLEREQQRNSEQKINP